MTPAELESTVLPKLDTLYRVAQRLVSSSADAEDLVASTLEAGFKACAQCDGRYPLAWLLQIMRNLSRHHYRHQARVAPSEADLEVVIDPTAHHRFLAKISELDVLAALERLPEEYRLVVTLCDLEEFDYVEAAIALDVPVGTIRSRLSRGRKLLQDRLVRWSQA
jgi:RNA polymerase sigma-70 factor (ECF subfamily)